jgi:hypothetical protein
MKLARHECCRDGVLSHSCCLRICETGVIHPSNHSDRYNSVGKSRNEGVSSEHSSTTPVCTHTGVTITLMLPTRVHTGVTAALQSQTTPEYEKQCTSDLMRIVDLVRGELTPLQRATLGASPPPPPLAPWANA